jgi:superfamily II DNA/RNA helicase
MTSFAALGLSPPLVRAAFELGYEAPTPVQAEAIPAVLEGRDVWGSAPTGSGKTAAYLLPLLERGAARAQGGDGRGSRFGPARVRVLVVVPTRELAAQVGGAVADLARSLPARVKACVAVGGVSINPQMLAVRGGVDVLVATPGRLLDLEEQGALDLGSVETLVLDEADRLLSLGFAEELARVLALLGPCQRLLFSATFPPAVRELAAGLLERPVRVAVAGGAPLAETSEHILQRALEVDAAKRTPLLVHLFSAEGWSRALVFVASRKAADRVAEALARAGIACAALHGELSQEARTRALSDFRASRARALVATDLAARGIDLPELPAVVNYDLPRSPVDYLHRIGRTGRAGHAGVAVSFLSADSAAHFRLIEKRHALRLPREQVAGYEPVSMEPSAKTTDPHGGVKGKRKSKKDKLRERAAASARK